MLAILLVKAAYSQNYSYAWINDIRIGSAGSVEALYSMIDDINNKHELKFVIVTGSLTENGTDAQLNQVHNILGKLNIPWHVLPGRRDLEYSQSAGYKFKKLFKEDNFAFDYRNVEHIGLNTGLIWNGYGHVSVENLKWLSSVLSKIPADRRVVLYSSFPLNSGIDNWYTITNSLSAHQFKVFLTGGSRENKLTDFSGIKSAAAKTSLGVRKRWTYTVVTEHPDTMFFTSITDNKINRWGILKKDSSSYKYHPVPAFRNYTLNKKYKKSNSGIRLLWTKDINETLSSSLCVYKNRIFVSTEKGRIYCLNSSGNNLWKYSARETFAGAPVYAKGDLIAGSLQGDLIAVNAASGRVVQSIGLNEPITSQLATIGGEYNGQKTDGVIIGTSGGDIYFYEASTFELIWENHSARGTINTEPLIIKNRIIYSSGDGHLYCIDAGSGIINWKWKGYVNSSIPTLFNPVGNYRNVYAVSPDSYLYAVDLMLGITVWKKDYDAYESMNISRDKKEILLKSKGNYFYVISAEKGKIKKKVNTGCGRDYLKNMPVMSGRNILFAAQNGCIYRVDKKSKCDKLFFMGNSPLLNIKKLNGNIFIAANKDGKIIAFKMK